MFDARVKKVICVECQVLAALHSPLLKLALLRHETIETSLGAWYASRSSIFTNQSNQVA